jgi:hypothetical protein
MMVQQSEILSSSQIQFITLFSPGAHSVAVYLFTSHSHRKVCNYAELKTNDFPEPNQTRHVFTFLHPILLVWSHILSTAGWRCDALKTSSSNAQFVVTVQKHFSHIQVFSYELFTIKTQPGTASKSRCETTNSKPLGPIKLSSQSEKQREQSINTI